MARLSCKTLALMASIGLVPCSILAHGQSKTRLEHVLCMVFVSETAVAVIFLVDMEDVTSRRLISSRRMFNKVSSMLVPVHSLNLKSR